VDAADLDPDPVLQFLAWLADAAEAGIREPNAMTLATATTTGEPSARIVLLRGVDVTGFTWYTNQESRKGRDIAENPRAALVFHWDTLERQVRIVGAVHRFPTTCPPATSPVVRGRVNWRPGRLPKASRSRAARSWRRRTVGSMTSSRATSRCHPSGVATA